VKLLLDIRKVDLDFKDSKYGRTPLLYTLEKGHEAIVKRLLDTGKVDLDLANIYRRTPLLYTLEEGREVIVKLLLNTGKVDLDFKNSKYGRTSLLYTL
jgi:ankyrin repeat domain-containing protein 50